MANKALFIDGQWLDGEGESLQSIDSAKKQVIWQAYGASSSQVEAAVLAARQAFKAWSLVSFSERLSVLKAYIEEVKHYQQQLALLISQETGKPLWESATEVSAMIGKLALSERAYHERTGEKEADVAGTKAFVRHKAHGVLAVFGPYNFPAHLPNGHIIPALLAGNTIVFKPSELAPATAEFCMRLWQKSGLAKGVINLLQGSLECSKALLQQSQLDGVLFTGSSATGRLIHQHLASQPSKILALEMGGNNPLIVNDAEDIGAAVYTIIQSAFISAGQRCTCARRLLIPDNTFGDALLTRLIEVTKTLKVGLYDDEPQPFMGALVSHAQAQAILTSQQSLIKAGATALLESRLLAPKSGLLSPGIILINDVNNLPDEEDFGPLLKVIKYPHFEHAIELANNTRFGLSAGLLSSDETKWQLFYQQIRAGIVNWNKPITGASGSAPFGGIGDSGNHKPSAFYAADYCAYPVASIESESLCLPANLTPGVFL